MEKAAETFQKLIDVAGQDYENIYEDTSNQTGYNMKVKGKTIISAKGSKVQATRQSFELKVRPELFIYVSNDVDIQTRVNTNLSVYEKLFSHKFEDGSGLGLYLTKSKKIMMIDSRESLYVKYCKKIDENNYLSINKSVLLKGVGEEGSLKTNMMLTGFQYKYTEGDVAFIYTRNLSPK